MIDAPVIHLHAGHQTHLLHIPDAAPDYRAAVSCFPVHGGGQIAAQDNENSMPARKAAPAQNLKKSKRTGLFLRFSSENDKNIIAAKNYIEQNKGDLPVYFYYLNTKKYVRLNNQFCVSGNKMFIDGLKSLLGSENVALIL